MPDYLSNLSTQSLSRKFELIMFNIKHMARLRFPTIMLMGLLQPRHRKPGISNHVVRQSTVQNPHGT